MAYVITPYVLISAFAAAMALVVAAVAWQRRSAPGGRPLVGLMVAVFIWSAGAAIEYATIGIPGKIVWGQVQYIGVVSCPVFFLLLALEQRARIVYHSGHHAVVGLHQSTAWSALADDHLDRRARG
jgi:hypothetical protein